MKHRFQKHNNLSDNDYENKNSTILLIKWAVISTGLWLITPQQFTRTDGPAGVLTMVVVGIIGLFLSIVISTLIQSSKK
ncbi:MAG: hypothetical protein K0U68_03185 [Gammaproteobacteria bacterium]|nr:hypothetical protein [Gammaproteobacteria bacterium]